MERVERAYSGESEQEKEGESIQWGGHGVKCKMSVRAGKRERRGEKEGWSGKEGETERDSEGGTAGDYRQGHPHSREREGGSRGGKREARRKC